MRGFVAGFLTASALAVATWYLWLGPSETPLSQPQEIAAPLPDEPGAKERPRRRAGRGRRARDEAARPVDDSDISDDLVPDALALDLGEQGGERPLPGSEIEATMDRNWDGIRRCTYGDAAERTTPVTGTVRLGIRIRPDGSVAAVSATAPQALRDGSLVPCLRRTVAGIRFPSFEGRETVVSYPIRIE